MDMSEREPAAGHPIQRTVSVSLNVLARKLLPLGLLLVLGYIVWLARDALAPFLVGLLIIYLLMPVVLRIEAVIPDKGKLVDLERPVAALLGIGLALLIAVVTFAILLDPLVQQTTALFNELSTALTNLDATEAGWRGLYQDRVPEQVREWLEANIEQVGQQLFSGTMGVASIFLSFTTNIAGSLFALLTVPLFIIFYLIDEKNTPVVLREQLPVVWAEDAVAMFRIADRILGSYTRAVLVQAVIIATITAIGYWIVGIDMALPLGIIAGTGAIIPIVGLWLSLLITAPIVFVTQPDHIVQAVIVYFVVQLFSGWVLMPKIQGSSVDFTTTGVLLIIAIAGAIAGPLGMIFGLPVAAIVRAIAVYTYYRLGGDTAATALGKLRPYQTRAELARTKLRLQQEAGTTRRRPLSAPAAD